MGSKKELKEDEKSYRKRLEKERTVYVEHQYDQSKQCDQNLFYISSGVFGISFTFIDKVVSTPTQETKWLIITSWSLILFCIIASLLAYIINYYGHKCAIQYIDFLIDKNSKANEYYCKLTILTILAEIMNVINLVALSSGLVFLLIYIAFNI